VSEPATKDDLKNGMDELRAEMVAMEKRIKAELLQAFERYVTQIGNMMVERVASEVRVLDDKYRDLPREASTLRTDLDDHRTNLRIHVRPPPPKTAR
jgi:hypothetical protein